MGLIEGPIIPSEEALGALGYILRACAVCYTCFRWRCRNLDPRTDALLAKSCQFEVHVLFGIQLRSVGTIKQMRLKHPLETLFHLLLSNALVPSLLPSSCP